MFDKLELESEPVDKTNYTEMLNRSVKSVIDRKLPDRIYMSLAHKDINTIYKLKQASMELYNASPENQRSNRSEGNRCRYRENHSQSNNQRYYRNRNHDYSYYYAETNQNNSNQPTTNQSQYSPRLSYRVIKGEIITRLEGI